MLERRLPTSEEHHGRTDQTRQSTSGTGEF
jgi:hypothetical protein